MYAVVTGATSGIGREIAKILAGMGYDLVLVGRRKERLVAMKKMFFSRYHSNVLIYEYDLSKIDNCIELFTRCEDLKIDIVCNCAGFGKVGYFTDTDLIDDINMIDINIKALHVLTKLFAKKMRSGNIINIASIAAYFPGPYMAEYGATKAYVLRLGQAVNYEMKKQNKKVLITTVCPGAVKTEFDKVSGAKLAMNAITAKECADIAVKGMLQNKKIVVPKLSTKILSKISGIVPSSIILPVEYYIQKSKVNNSANKVIGKNKRYLFNNFISNCTEMCGIIKRGVCYNNKPVAKNYSCNKSRGY